ncbi:hypothetical protein L2Y94_01620 [Luteibacter aegosomatis]|uniref:dermonecrotic toxin domain-containing protein n=1 Tax=Luteibacter aegosomatis TaxID=2911537 RepID=UPI001FF76F1E|nr:DUF6543 domain-containing protein [Luteibacter aegosomatis]UPG86088.1 hypothetical protein L2Y94_01620 [Luteibacter aegosomatis]
MAPPQAPPAIVSSSRQEMDDAIRRLVSAQARQNELSLALPPLPDAPTSADKRDYLSALDRFWHDPSTGRDATLRTHLADVMRDEAILRGFDGTLDERAREMATAFARSVDQAPPFPLKAHHLMIHDAPYAGAVVVTGTEADPALLFFPESGWESYTDSTALLDAVERKARQWLRDGRAPPGISLDEVDDEPTERLVRLDAMHGSAFLGLLSVVPRQRERVEAAWNLLFDGELPDDERTLAVDALRNAVRLDILPDIRRLMAAHERRLIHKVTEERLMRAPTNVADDWRRAMAAYESLQRVSEQWTWLQLPDIEAFTDDLLARRLSDIGVTHPVEDIFVTSEPRPLPFPGCTSGAGRVERIELRKLALQNLGRFDLRCFHPVDGTGRSLDGQLPATELGRLVRAIDVGGAYARLIRTTFSDSIEGAMRRSIATGALRIRLRLEAEEARLAAALSDDIASAAGRPLKDLYRWVDGVLDEPVAKWRAKDGQDDIVVRQVMYKGIPVAGMLVIGSSSRYEARQVLYTPDAPDGLTFREFRQWSDVEREILYHPSFESYLLDRLPPRFATTQSNGVRVFFVSESTRLRRWVFGGYPPANTTHTDEAFTERAIDGDVLESLYDAEVSLREAQVELVARSSAQADDDHPLIDPAAFARRFAHFIGRASMAGWRFYDQVKAKNAPQAFVEFTATYTAMLDFGLAVAWKPLLANAIIVRSAQRSLQLRPFRVDLTTSATLFEARFAFTCAKCAKSVANMQGIHHIDGQTAISQGGRLYAVRYDASAQTWRLTRPGAPDANFSGPAVVHVGQGQWQYRTDVGLLGGAPPPVGSTTMSVLREHRQRVADLRGLSDAQLERLSSHLVAGKGTDTGARKLAWRKISREPLTAVERQRWQAAVDWARGHPSTPPPAPPAPPRPPVRVEGLPAPIPGAGLSHEAIAVDRAQWPRYVWHYTDDTAMATMRGERFQWLEQSASRRGYPSGAYVTTLDPARNDLDQVAVWLSGRNAWTRQANRPEMTARWLKLDLDALPPGYTVHRVTNVHDGTYLIRSPRLSGAGHAGDVEGALPAIPLQGVFVSEGRRGATP